MFALTIYKIIALSMLFVCIALYWPLRAASARVKREIDQLAAQDAESQSISRRHASSEFLAEPRRSACGRRRGPLLTRRG